MKYFKKFTFLIILTTVLSSCEEYLDKVPESGITDDKIFSDFFSFRGYNDRLYHFMRDYHDWKPRYTPGSMADLEECALDWQAVNAVNNGDYFGKGNHLELGWNTTGQAPNNSSPITNAFQALRIANMSIENIDRLKNATEEQKNRILGQAYFFRAWYNFELIIRYGGMPYFDKAYTSDMNMDFPRLTYRESTNRIVEDCIAAAELLPKKWNDAELGRVTRGAAMSLKGIALLYDASPTMNPDLGYQYDLDRAEEAAIELYDVIELANEGVYSLHPGDSYREMFFSRTLYASSEYIFFIVNNNFRASLDIRQLYVPPTYDNGNPVTVPTQNAVDLYEMSNGLPIDEEGSGYDPTNPYVDRDPRFYNNILYNGEAWGKNSANEQLYIETFLGGKDHHSKIIHWTGYFNKKYWPRTGNNDQDDYDYYMNWIHIRLSQIYLDYAEAVNEVWGPNGSAPGANLTALEAVNMIRARVGMPDVAARFTGDKNLFRERIRNERAIELFGEHKRWWDLRRWHVMHLDKHKKIYRMRIDKVGDNSYTYNVEEIESEKRVFEEKHYWYPLPKDHIEMLTNLEQNPGW